MTLAEFIRQLIKLSHINGNPNKTIVMEWPPVHNTIVNGIAPIGHVTEYQDVIVIHKDME